MMYFLKGLVDELIKVFQANILGYYKSIDKIPIYNWDKVTNGEYKYLFKRRIGIVPEYFKTIVSDMFFQLEKVNMDHIRERLDVTYVRSLYVTTKDIQYYNKANFMQKALDKKLSKKVKRGTLNDQVNLIETTFNSIGSIDVHKVNAQRFYSMFNLAVKKIEASKKNGNN